MLSVLDLLLLPLARLSIAKGLTFADVAERLKLAFLRAAQGLAGRGATASRLSVMAGLQRRDIARLSALPDVLPPRAPGHLSRLILLWRDDPAYSGADLPRRGPAPSFEDLARRVRRDVHPRTLSDQLIADGSVTETADGLLHLARDAHLPAQGSDAQLAWLGANLGDHLAVAVDNVLEGPPRFERAAHANLLSAAAVERLEALWRDRAMAALAEIAAEAERLQESQPGAMRFRAGAWFRQEDGTE